MPPKYVYGIDFGTSNSGVSIWNNETKALVEHPSIQEAEPTLLYFPDAEIIGRHHTKVLLGKDAITNYVGDNMQGRLLQSIKTFLPDKSFTETKINGKEYTIEELAAFVIRHLKRKADSVTGENVKVAVMGRPAVFHEDAGRDRLAQERLESAARQAGFEKVYFQYEPIAAAFAYEQSIQTPQTALVGDFGGGTSDFAILKLDPEKRTTANRLSDVLASGGVSVAGNALDSAVMWEKVTPVLGRGAVYKDHPNDPGIEVPNSIFWDMCHWERYAFLWGDKRTMDWMWRYSKLSDKPKGFEMSYALIKHNCGFALFRAIEKAKIALAREDSARIAFAKREIEINIPLDIAGFDAATAAKLEPVSKALEQTVAKSGITASGISSVFLTGGTSRVRSIRRMLERQFGAGKIHSGDDFMSVSKGLALSTPVFLGRE